jgi:hypothetical protein
MATDHGGGKAGFAASIRANSLLTGNSAGNFADCGRFSRFAAKIHQRLQSLPAKFPTQSSREFLPA